MADHNRRQLRRATIVFWVLLVYIILALLWWAFSLEQQNRDMYRLRKAEIAEKLTDTTSINYKNAIAKINEQKQRNTVKYISEGITFLVLIIVGAVFLYRSVRRQFRLQQQQQNFVMAVTHELKTPISVARLNLETLQRHHLDIQRQRKLIQGSLEEMVRLEALINNILISSQLEGGAYPASKEELNFSDLVEDVCRQFRNRYPHRQLVTTIEDQVALTGDSLLLKLLVSNLLENANKYSDKTTPVQCIVKKDLSGVRLQVSDEGIGIPDAEKRKVFDRFYRIGNEQTRHTKGTGLGLFICKKIADYHHASISVTDNAGRGSTFTVQFLPA
ncbi:MAG: two-component sensor histidine kinase [Flavisolibacter sp.]|nr:two-component sensor histidine kinase [Flavisolibacter sp.]